MLLPLRPFAWLLALGFMGAAAGAGPGAVAAGSIVADNEYRYDARGNLLAELQEYGNATILDEQDPAASPRTGYTWAFSSADAAAAGHDDEPQGDNYDRLSVMMYPYGRSGEYRTLHFAYGDDGDAFESALTHMTGIESRMNGAAGSDHGVIAEYAYLGDGRCIGRAWRNDDAAGQSQIVLQLDPPLSTHGTGYEHLDRFGRLTDLHVQRPGGETVHRYQYRRDPAGDVLACWAKQVDGMASDRENVYSYLYEYDGLKRLADARRGALNATRDGLEPNETARHVAWGLDSLGNWALPSGGRLEEDDPEGDGSYDTVESFVDFVNLRNEIETRSGQLEYIYDAVGNLIADDEFYYVYDAWSRLIQVCGRGTVQQDQSGAIVGTPGDWIVHYAYDAFGRLVASQRPWPGSPSEVRTTRHYYDGSRRIQDVHIDPVVTPSAPAQSSIPAPGSGGSPPLPPPPDPGVSIHVACDYIYTPGYIDEYQCLVDSTGEIQHVIQDGNYNVVGLIDGYGDLLAQYVYDPYGSLVAGDIDLDLRAAIGHQGLFFDRLDAGLQAQPFTVEPDGLGGFLPPVAGVYHNRNRTYHPQLGRFLQRDPNGTGSPVSIKMARHDPPTAPAGAPFAADVLFADGMNVYQYLSSSPGGGFDPTGLFFGLPDLSVSAALRGGLRAYETADTARSIFEMVHAIAGGMSLEMALLTIASEAVADRIGGPVMDTVLNRFRTGIRRARMAALRRGNDVESIFDVDFYTANGLPNWNTVRERYWKLMIGRSTAPRAKILLRKNGQLQEAWVSMELHHITGREIGDMPAEYMDEIVRNRVHAFQGLQPRWPWEHAAVDPHRYLDYEFVDWIDTDFN